MASVPFIAPLSIMADGLTIRHYTAGDGPALRIATISSYEHLRPWMPWATREQTEEEAESNARRFCARYMLNEDFVLGAWIEDELVGGTGFHLRSMPLTARSAEIGMWIRGDRAAQGLGTRVLGQMLDWGFTEWGWQRLTWHCDTRNLASAQVARKNGLNLEATLHGDTVDVEGRRRDAYLFAMLREDWTQRKEAQAGSRP